MVFRGWPADAIEFFEGLEADNSKAYWQAHKPVYEAHVRGPMDELLADLAGEFGSGKVFRPNRDVRFSADKSPYKTNIAAMVTDGGYLQLSVNGLGAGSGMWMMAPDQLSRYRDAVAGDAGTDLEAVLAALRKSGYDASGHGVLKTAPKGYPRDHPRVELLRYKGITAWKEWPVGAWLGKSAARDRVVTFFRAARPLRSWLDTHVGASTVAEGGPGG
jgi:uncharacterized protein (TIGR02453 family)